MNLIPGIDAAMGGLNAQRTRLDVVAQNIANAQTTRGPDGAAYVRKVVSFETELVKRTGGAALSTVRVSSISPDATPGHRVHNPGHPDADTSGYVRLPNVNMALEMVDLISASRAYEANLAVVRAGRELAQRTLEIGR